MIGRGSIVLVALPGDYGKPRPAVIVQADIARSLDSTIVCPLTSFYEDAAELRPKVEPTSENGLTKRSYVMVEKVMTIKRAKVQTEIGTMERELMGQISEALALLLGIV